MDEENVQMNIFDKVEIYPDCTVEIYINTVTKQRSIGWWPNDNPPIELGGKDG